MAGGGIVPVVVEGSGFEEGRAGPKSSSLSEESESGCGATFVVGAGGDGGAEGRSSRGAGGMAGPITLLFLEASSGLLECFAPEAVEGAFSALSSCWRLRFARRCGGRFGPIADIILRWFCCVFRRLSVVEGCRRGASEERSCLRHTTAQ